VQNLRESSPYWRQERSGPLFYSTVYNAAIRISNPPLRGGGAAAPKRAAGLRRPTSFISFPSLVISCPKVFGLVNLETKGANRLG